MEIKKYGLVMTMEKHPKLIEEEIFPCVETDFSTAEKVVCVINQCIQLEHKAEEYLYMVAFTTSMHPLGIFEISHGTVNKSIFSPREILIRSLLCGAAGIILIHNHPGGNIMPSKEDYNVAEQMNKILKGMGIIFLDFIILGDSYFSFCEKKLIK